MDLSHWEFNRSEESAAAEVAEKIATARDAKDFPVYTNAVAIDGPTTKDRDDAIYFKFDEGALTIEAYIADPTRFIPTGSILDKAAAHRTSALYLREKNYPMLPRSLCDDALSLNQGRVNPAIKISTRINTVTGRIESVSTEKCWVKPENMTYEEVSKRIQHGDGKYEAWNKAAIWLRNFRQKNSNHILLPSYDPDSGIMQKEDGVLEYVSPHLVNAYNIVQEAMIMTNHAAGLLMENGFDYGVYRGQPRVNSSAHYTDKPEKHASLGVATYTHATSPNRRYCDVMVHRYLSRLGDKFELKLDAAETPLFTAPLTRGEQQVTLDKLNNFGAHIKAFYKAKREEIAQDWLGKVFPDTDPDKLKTFDPIGFSILLKAAAKTGKINEVFAAEVEARIKGTGGEKQEYSLVPKDAINIFRYAPGHSNAHWDNLRTLILEQLASNPHKLDEVFAEFVEKIGGKFHITAASFITKPQKNTNEPARYTPVASAVVAQINGEDFTTPEFAIGFSAGHATSRAKLEFLKAYASSSLVRSDTPQLPKENELYVAQKLYVENAQERKWELMRAGYKVEESIKTFAQSPESLNSLGYKYEVKISKDGKPVISVTVRREDEEEAKRIGLETVILELRGKGGMSKNPFAHTGLSTFTGKLRNAQSPRIDFDNPLIVLPRQTKISDSAACYELEDILNASGCIMHKDGKDVHIMAKSSQGNQRSGLDITKEKIIKFLPKATVVMKPDSSSIIIKNAPQDLIQLCSNTLGR